MTLCKLYLLGLLSLSTLPAGCWLIYRTFPKKIAEAAAEISQSSGLLPRKKQGYPERQKQSVDPPRSGIGHRPLTKE
jgi:hypothetical protein